AIWLFGAIAIFVVVLGGAGKATAATPSLHQMYANPVATPAPAADSSSAGSNYLLRRCQVCLSLGSCYDPYQMRTAYGVDSLIANGNDGTGKTIVILDAFDDPYLQT